jgi:hypothetical protein
MRSAVKIICPLVSMEPKARSNHVIHSLTTAKNPLILLHYHDFGRGVFHMWTMSRIEAIAFITLVLALAGAAARATVGV